MTCSLQQLTRLKSLPDSDQYCRKGSACQGGAVPSSVTPYSKCCCCCRRNLTIFESLHRMQIVPHTHCEELSRLFGRHVGSGRYLASGRFGRSFHSRSGECGSSCDPHRCCSFWDVTCQISPHLGFCFVSRLALVEEASGGDAVGPQSVCATTQL